MRNTYKRYTAKHRAMIKKHILTMAKACSSFVMTDDEIELYTVTYNALDAERRAFSKAMHREIGFPEFVKMFI